MLEALVEAETFPFLFSEPSFLKELTTDIRRAAFVVALERIEKAYK